MYCLYYVTNISRGSAGAPYLERMDQAGNVVPLLADGNAYVTLIDSRYTITNSTGETLFTGNCKKAMDDALGKLNADKVLINGKSRSKYYSQFEPLIYHICATKPDATGAVYAVMSAEKGGFIQGNWQLCGLATHVEEEINEILDEERYEYIISYVSSSRKFDSIVRSERVPASPFDRQHLKARMKAYKKEVSAPCSK